MDLQLKMILISKENDLHLKKFLNQDLFFSS